MVMESQLTDYNIQGYRSRIHFARTRTMVHKFIGFDKQ